MATTRKFKTARNNQAINAFLDLVVGSVQVGSLNAMQKIANRGIQTLVKHVATFGDYTGEMINSYQAAILKNGKLPHGGSFTMSGQLSGASTYESTFRGPRGDVRLITSLGKAHNAISYARATKPGISPKTGKEIQKKTNSIALRDDPTRRVNPNVSPTIKMPKTKHYQGYGRDITDLRTYSPRMKVGIEVVFNNPTPYAQHVMENNEGSHVMPLGEASVIVPHGALFTLTDAEIHKVIQRAKRYKRR